MKKWFICTLALCLGGVSAATASAGHSDGCCPPTRKECIEIPGVKKTTTTVYAVKEVDYCTRKYSLLDLFRHKCDAPCDPCGCGKSCGTPRVKRVLIKKERVCEQPTTTCEVTHVLCPTPCPTPCGTVNHQSQPVILQGSPAPSLEKAPMPNPK